MKEAQIPQELLDLPFSHEKIELLWCAALVSMVDWETAPFESQALARAANCAIQIATELLQK